jgi:hypothetical protein
MANLFDATNAPEGEPTEVVVGDFLQWKRSDLVADYPTDEYTATYVARITGGGSSEIQLEMTGQTTHYLATVSSETSADFEVGEYHWQLEIVQDSSGNRIVVDLGDFKAIADLDNNQADPRTHSEITLDKIESLIQGKADNDAQEYSIAGRQLKKYSFNELLGLRDYYKREVAKEKAERDIKQGRKSSSTVKVRFM